MVTPWGCLQPLESLSVLGSAPASIPVLEHVAFWSQGRTDLLQRNLPGGDSATSEPLAQLLSLRKTSSKCLQWGLPQWSFPRVGKIPWKGKWQPTPVLLPGESHGQRSLDDYSPWSREESDMTERLILYYYTISPVLKTKTFVHLLSSGSTSISNL